MWNDLVWDMPETLKMANANPQSQDVEIVRKVIRKEESVLRSVLMQKVGSRGINKDRLDKAIDTLLAEESVKITQRWGVATNRGCGIPGKEVRNENNNNYGGGDVGGGVCTTRARPLLLRPQPLSVLSRC